MTSRTRQDQPKQTEPTYNFLQEFLFLKPCTSKQASGNGVFCDLPTPHILLYLSVATELLPAAVSQTRIYAFLVKICWTVFGPYVSSSKLSRPEPSIMYPMAPRKFITVWNPPNRQTMFNLAAVAMSTALSYSGWSKVTQGTSSLNFLYWSIMKSKVENILRSLEHVKDLRQLWCTHYSGCLTSSYQYQDGHVIHMHYAMLRDLHLSISLISHQCVSCN